MPTELERKVREILEGAEREGYMIDTSIGLDLLREIAAALQAQQPGARMVGYGYFAKGSGNLVIVEEKFSFLPHVFPLYTHPQPTEGTTPVVTIPEPSDSDVEAASIASGLPIKFPNDRKRVLDALTTYAARLRERIGGRT
jgi:hypothetical protein